MKLKSLLLCQYVMLCAIWYYWCNLKKIKSTHGGVLPLVKLCVFHIFKIVQMVANRAKRHVWFIVQLVNKIVQSYVSAETPLKYVCKNCFFIAWHLSGEIALIKDIVLKIFS